MAIYEFEGRRPKVSLAAYVHPLASVIGSVTIADRCFIGPGASLRAEWCEITLGEGSSVQDSSTIHGGVGVQINIGPATHIGHGAVVHGALIGQGVLIGMNAVINDGAEIGDWSIIGAGAIVPRHKKIPSRKLVVGVPARVIADLSDTDVADLLRGGLLYEGLPPRYRESLREISREEAAGSTG